MTPTHSTEKPTPRTDAITRAILAVIKQHADGHIYTVDLEGFLHGELQKLAQLERELIAATTPTPEQIEACATLETRAIANEQARDELHRILVMLKREMDEHVSDKTKNELPKAAWHSACDRANAVMANFLL